MDIDLTRLFQCLQLLGLAPPACLAELEANGIPVRDALAAILAEPPLPALTPALARARCGAGLAQARPDLFGVLGELLLAEGSHPLSLLNWAGWDRDLAFDLLQTHWRGPGPPPLALLGIGRAVCAELRVLPRGLRLQNLRLTQCPDLGWLPEGLEVQGDLELWNLGLRRVPGSLRVGGNLVLVDLPRLEGWGEGIRIGGDLVLSGLRRRGAPPRDLKVGGQVRQPEHWRPSREWWT